MPKQEIIEISHFSEIQGPVKRILMECSTEYNLQYEPGDYLQVIEEKGPVAPQELAKATGKSYNVCRRAINHLVEEGFVEKVGEKQARRGKNASRYNIVDKRNLKQSIQCEHKGCSGGFATFKGRVKRTNIVHGDERGPENTKYRPESNPDDEST